MGTRRSSLRISAAKVIKRRDRVMKRLPRSGAATTSARRRFRGPQSDRRTMATNRVSIGDDESQGVIPTIRCKWVPIRLPSSGGHLAPPDLPVLRVVSHTPHLSTHRWRGGRVAEGGGLLNRYTAKTRIVGSNPIPSANSRQFKSNSTFSSAEQTRRRWFGFRQLPPDCHPDHFNPTARP
jgi:hypothetical protein